MNLLRIEQTYGMIGVETRNSKADIRTQQSRLNLQQTYVKIEIDKQAPTVKIDQHGCFATAGLKNVFELTEEAAQAGQQQAMEYTAKKAADGDMLANIKSGGNPIAEIAKRDSYQEHEFNIDLIPKVRPKIDFEGYIRLSAEMGEVESSVKEGYVKVNFTENKIRLYLAQKPSLQIQYIGKKVDTYV